MEETDQHKFKDRYMLRFPDGMRDRIKEAAASNNRSMNAEIVQALQTHYEKAPKKVDKAEFSEILSLHLQKNPEQIEDFVKLMKAMIDSMGAMLPKLSKKIGGLGGLGGSHVDRDE